MCLRFIQLCTFSELTIVGLQLLSCDATQPIKSVHAETHCNLSERDAHRRETTEICKSEKGKFTWDALERVTELLINRLLHVHYSHKQFSYLRLWRALKVLKSRAPTRQSSEHLSMRNIGIETLAVPERCYAVLEK